MGIAWTVSEIIGHLLFSWLRLWPWMKVEVNIINTCVMHYHVWSSNRAKLDDDDLNGFRGIACEGHTHTQGRQKVFISKSLRTLVGLLKALAQVPGRRTHLNSYPPSWRSAGRLNRSQPQAKTYDQSEDHMCVRACVQEWQQSQQNGILHVSVFVEY